MIINIKLCFNNIYYQVIEFPTREFVRRSISKAQEQEKIIRHSFPVRDHAELRCKIYEKENTTFERFYMNKINFFCISNWRALSKKSLVSGKSDFKVRVKA